MNLVHSGKQTKAHYKSSTVCQSPTYSNIRLRSEPVRTDNLHQPVDEPRTRKASSALTMDSQATQSRPTTVRRESCLTPLPPRAHAPTPTSPP